MVAGMKVVDPRLKYVRLFHIITYIRLIRLSFPPKNTKVVPNERAGGSASIPAGLWPTTKLAFSDLWDSAVRQRLENPKFKKKDIDSRKSKVCYSHFL